MRCLLLLLAATLWQAVCADTGDTLLISEVADSVRTITVRMEGVKHSHIPLHRIAIGNRHLLYAQGWSYGNIYRMDNGQWVRELNGGQKYSDCLLACLPALDPMSVRMASGDEFYARGCYEDGWSKHLYIVRGQLTDSIRLDSLPVDTQMQLRVAGDSLRYASCILNPLTSLYAEYNVTAEQPTEVHETCRHLWLRYRHELILFNKETHTSRNYSCLKCGDTVQPIGQLIGFGPKHIAFAQAGNENEVMITICRIK